MQVLANLLTPPCSEFSETLVCYTLGIVPPPPLPPKLKEAGVTWLSLEWSPPAGVSTDDSLTYVLEMEEDGSVSFWCLEAGRIERSSFPLVQIRMLPSK